MIKIIEPTDTYRLKCSNCWATIEYEDEDIQEIEIGFHEYSYDIKCPLCHYINTKRYHA